MTVKTAYKARGGTSYSSLPVEPLPSYPDPDVFVRYRDVIKGLVDRVDMLAGVPNGAPSVIKQVVQQSGGSGGGGTLVLEPATVDKLGGIKVGSGLTITADGVLAVPIASANTRGSVKVGSGLTVAADGTLSYTLPIAAANTLGGIKVGARLTIDQNGVLSADQQSYTLPIATANALGGIKVGARLTIDAQTGVLSADVQSYSLPIASATVLGGIKVGARLTINAQTGVLDANDQSYTLPIATANALGGIKVGARLTIDAQTGVLSADVQSPQLPVATATVLGGVKIGNGLTIQQDGLLDGLTDVPPEFSLAANQAGQQASKPTNNTNTSLVSVSGATNGTYPLAVTVDDGLPDGLTIYPGQTIDAALVSGDPDNPLRPGRKYKDYELIRAIVGNSYTIDHVGSNPPITGGIGDAYLQLVNGDTGALITYDDDSGGNLNSRITFTAQVGIRYMVRATTYTAGVTGNFRLSVTGVAAPPPNPTYQFSWNGTSGPVLTTWPNSNQAITGGVAGTLTFAPDAQAPAASGTDQVTISGANGRGYRIAWLPVAAKKVLIGPVNGADAAPTFRELVLSDLPPGIGGSGSSGQDFRYYYIHSQTVPATTWIVTHALGKVPTGILVVRDDGIVVDPGIEISQQSENSYYEHVQGGASVVWTINHGLLNVITGITVLADGPGYVDPKFEIDRTTPFQVRITFDQARTGRAYVSTGANSNQLTLKFLTPTAGKAYVSIGAGKPPYNHVQSVAAQVWTVNHGLGRVPTQIQAFDANGAVLDPRISVVEDSPYTLQLAFDQARTGQAWVS